MREVLCLTASSTSENMINRCFLDVSHFLLAHFGYTFKLNYDVKILKRYIALFAILICYSIVSLKTIFSDDFAPFAINVIWTVQIFVTAIINHLEVKENRKKKAAGSLPTTGGPSDGTAWGHRLIYYTIAVVIGIAITLYTLTQGVKMSYDIFALVAYIIALFDGILEVLVGIFEATID